MKKISVIFGTRPEAIKMAPVVLAFKNMFGLSCKVCITAQHRQMLDQVLEVFGINPDIDLNLMAPDQSLAALTAKLIQALDRYLVDEKPDLVLVQGDTTTVLCASLAAFYHNIPIGHVEAGLRTGDMRAPWPEEANRVITSHLAQLHFAPTESARRNLLREGVPDKTIYVTGNTVIDALFLALEKIRAAKPFCIGLPDFLQPSSQVMGRTKMVLITGHRRENFGPGFINICEAISDLAAQFPDTHFVYPVHLNPNVRQPVYRILRVSESSPAANIHLIEPLSYLQFVALLEQSMLVLTDSGGVQEEAPSLGKPVLVMRDKTERPEAVDAGTVKLVGTSKEKIVSGVARLLSNTDAYREMSKALNPYGDGRAASRVAKVCLNALSS